MQKIRGAIFAMIEILNGMHETINYGNSLGLRLYHNVDYEDYPEHWHVGIEIIMPVEDTYRVGVGEQWYDLGTGDIIIINSGVIHALQAPPRGERMILQFDPALLYNLKEMETLLFMMPTVVFLKRQDDTELYRFLKERLDKIICEYDGNSTFREASIYASLIEMYVGLGRFEVYSDEHKDKHQSETAGVYRGGDERLYLHQSEIYGKPYAGGSGLRQRIFQVPFHQSFQTVYEHDLLRISEFQTCEAGGGTAV